MLAQFPLMKRIALSLMLCGLFASSTSSFALSDDEQRQARLTELKATIDQLKNELQNIRSNRNDLLSELETAETKIGKLSEKVKELREQLENKQSQLNQLQGEKEALARVKKQQMASVEQQINAAYRLGQQSSLKMLLNQQDPTQVARNMYYLDRVLSSQTTKIKTYVSTINRLEQLEPEITQATHELKQHHQTLEAKRQDLLNRFADRQRTLNKLDATLSSKDAQLAALEKDRKNLEDLLQRVVMVTGDLSVAVSNRPFKELKGKLLWPAKGKLLNRYGSSRVAGKIRWQGVTIGANEGTPVHAVHHGRVVFSDYLRGQGLLIIIDHGDGFLSLYAHNQTLYKDIGDWVSAGEQIAAVGLSGGQKRAALYFELRYQGKPTDPQAWLKKSA